MTGYILTSARLIASNDLSAFMNCLFMVYAFGFFWGFFSVLVFL